MLSSIILSLLSLVGGNSQLQTFPSITFMGQRLPNNSYVNISLLGSIQCHTNLHTCCSGEQGSHRGDWYFPNGSRLPFNGELYQRRTAYLVELQRDRTGDGSNQLSSSGIYRCHIPTNAFHHSTDRSVRDSIFLGLYENQNEGDVDIGEISLTEYQQFFTLTCVSFGGPATSVIWTGQYFYNEQNYVNDVTSIEGNVKVLNDPITAKYTHTLTLPGRSFGGFFTVTVSNAKPSVSTASFIDAYMSLNGIPIPNHGYVEIGDIGYTNSTAIQYIANFSGVENLNYSWIAPDGNDINSVSVAGLRITRSPLSVNLLRTNGTPPQGIYQCVIEDVKLYIGIYRMGQGQLSMSRKLNFTLKSDTHFTLTCVSIGGPATKVTWTRDSTMLTEYTKSVVNDTVTAKYIHTLMIAGKQAGYYECSVINMVSNVTSALDVQIPRAPLLKATQNGLNSVLVSWIYNTHWPPVAGFKITYRQLNRPNILGVFETGENSTNVSITGLIALSSYSVTIMTDPITLAGPSSTITFTLGDFTEVNGVAIPNHGLVLIENIGFSSDTGLKCHTNYSGIQPSGDWIAPDGTNISSGSVPGFTVTGGHPTLVLQRTTGSPQEGIYHCVVRNNTARFRVFFFGLYNNGNGRLSKEGSMKFVQTTQTQFIMSCISVSGPATTVAWTRGSVAVTDGIASSVLNNSVTAQYTHSLITSRQERYKVVVSNNISEIHCQLLVETPSTPSNLRTSQNGLNSMELSWFYHSRWPAIAGIIINYEEEGSGGHAGLIRVGPRHTSVTISELQALATYSITVATDPFTLRGSSATTSITLGHYILLGGRRINPNDYIAIDSIGFTETAGIHCQTNYSGVYSRGDWIAPDGTRVSGDGRVSGFRASGSYPSVILRRATGTPVQGIYQCLVNKYGTLVQTLNIGLYSGEGSINVSSVIEFTLNSDDQFTLTCISTSGPATIVSWKRNNHRISSPTVEKTVLSEQLTARYTHTLTVTGRLAGWYACNVENVVSSDSAQVYVSAPSTPTIRGISQIRENSLLVSWLSHSSDVTEFHISYQQQTGQHGGSMVAARTDTNVTINHLFKGATYTISLYARSTMIPSNPDTETYTLRALSLSSSPSDITAGDYVTLTCSFAPSVSGFNSFSMQGPGVSGVSRSSRVTIRMIRTSQAGVYYCSATYNGIAFQSSMILNVRIKITTSSISLGTTLIAGTRQTLICSSTVATTVVDSRVQENTAEWRVNNSVISTDTRITTPNSSALLFSPIYISDSGSYTCVPQYSAPDSPYVTKSQTPSRQISVSVTVPPAPRVTITTTGLSIAGQIYYLHCSASTILGLFALPNMMISFQSSTFVPVRATNSIWHTFNPLTISNGGLYVCTAVINIPQAGINNVYSSVTKTLEVVYAYPVQSFTYTQVEGAFTFYWSPPIQGAELILGYLLMCDPIIVMPGTGIAPYNQSLHVSSSSVVVSDLHPDTVYNCSMITVGSQGHSEPRYHIITTPETVPTGVPEMFEASVRKRTVIFYWSQVPPAQRNGNITNYTLSCFPSPSSLPQSISASSLTLTVPRFSPNMHYVCSLVASNRMGPGPAANISFTTQEDFAYIQLRLLNKFTLCPELKAEEELASVADQLMHQLKGLCTECTVSLLSEQELYCDESSPSSVMYRAKLDGTTETDSSSLVNTIEEWVKSGDSVMLAGQITTFDSECPVNISSLNDPDCLLQVTTTPSVTLSADDDVSSSSGNVGLVVGIIITTLLLTFVIIAIPIMIVVLWKRKRDFKATNVYEMSQVSGPSTITISTNNAYGIVAVRKKKKRKETDYGSEGGNYEIPLPSKQPPLPTIPQQEEEVKGAVYEVIPADK